MITKLKQYRVVFPSRYLDLIHMTGQGVRIRKTKYTRALFNGVPGKQCDLIIADSIAGHKYEGDCALEISEHKEELQDQFKEDIECTFEIGEKKGKYDHAIRDRYAIRRFSMHDLELLPRADLRIVLDMDADELTILIRPWNNDPIYAKTYPLSRIVGTTENVHNVIWYHIHKYFGHLKKIDRDELNSYVKSLEMEMVSTGPDMFLSAMHQRISQFLYRLSRNQGWHKLTKEMRDRLGMCSDASQWHHESELAPLYFELRGRKTDPRNGIGICEDPMLVAQITDSELIEMEFDEEMYGT